jgi:hypothetical protein
MGGGELACDETCQLDPSGCHAYTCGNGVADGSDACDGPDVNGETCENQGYDGGTLDCLANERLGGVKYPGLAGLWFPALRDFPPD